ncbi:DUF904 domain-containing protein [Undibacterium rugosum]|nr:DUF904 domain-containing protein [Undibacterium rugosum]
MMIPEFELLADKVARLAELTHALRAENAALRHELAGQTAKNLDMQQRIEQAQDRVLALIQLLPPEVVNQDQEEDAA